MQAAWDAAVAACLNGHANCSYGGMTPKTGYWLRDPDCQEKHGDVCAWCDAEAVTGFAGRAADGFDIYAVPACQPHADTWAEQHPEWTRRDKPVDEEPRSWAELLDSLNPFARALAEDYGRAMDEAILYGSGPRPSEPGFDGIGGLLGGMLGGLLHGEPNPAAPSVPMFDGLLPSLDTGRWRYNQTTKTWEAMQR